MLTRSVCRCNALLERVTVGKLYSFISSKTSIESTVPNPFFILGTNILICLGEQFICVSQRCRFALFVIKTFVKHKYLLNQ